jgi:Ca-activated chloride channel family protein
VSEALGSHLGQPWWLLGLALCALPLLRPPRDVGSYLRALAIALAVLALAAPTVPGGRTSVAVVVDVSDSVGDAALRRAAELVAGLAEPADLVLAGAEAVHVPTLPAAVPGFVTTSATCRGAAAGGAGRVLLVSDGVTPSGPLLSSLPPVPVDVAHVPSRPGTGLAELILPTQAAPGQTVEAVAVVRSDVAATVRVSAVAGGVALPTREVEVGPGHTAVQFTFTAGEGNATSVSVHIEADQPAGATTLTRELTLRARPPVLVVDDPAMAALLRTQGLDVVEGTPADVTSPLAYSAVVLRAGAMAFTPGQLDLLASFVQAGGGLLMTGGPESFGFGGWYRTPVEDVLPVTTDLRTEVTLPLVALVMVIDRSQSMATGSPSKIELAKEGAMQVVELAYEEDLLGLIAFSDEASTRWVFELRPATERGKREMLQGILGLGTGGGTVLGPAYEMAIEALADTQAAVKHVIVLSDGRLYDGSGPFGTPQEVPDFAAMAADALAAGITTSTIAIGAEADFDRLAAIAAAGGGRYYAALDVGTLPRIFSNEALTATRALLVDEPTVPRGRPNQLYDFPAALPPVDAYVATSLRPDAQELLAGREGEPILAVRRAGLGRTAALTTDLNGWAGSLAAWPDLPGALGTLGRWLQAVPPGYDATARRDGNELEVVVDAVRGGEYVNGERLVARYGGLSVELDQVGPGRYLGRLPYTPGGGQDVVVSRGSELVARAPVAGPDPEFAEQDGAALLEAVARRTGGTVVTGVAYAPDLGGAGRSLWQPLLVAALAVFLAELAWRRLAPLREAVPASVGRVSRPLGLRTTTARPRRPS